MISKWISFSKLSNMYNIKHIEKYNHVKTKQKLTLYQIIFHLKYRRRHQNKLKLDALVVLCMYCYVCCLPIYSSAEINWEVSITQYCWTTANWTCLKAHLSDTVKLMTSVSSRSLSLIPALLALWCLIRSFREARSSLHFFPQSWIGLDYTAENFLSLSMREKKM